MLISFIKMSTIALTGEVNEIELGNLRRVIGLFYILVVDQLPRKSYYLDIIFEAIDMLSSLAATDYFPRVGWIIERPYQGDSYGFIYCWVETSTTTLNWEMTELIRNPELMKKVQE